MDATDGLWSAIGGRGLAPSTGNSAQGLVSALVAMTGSGAKAARVLGVSPSSVYRWQRGASPKIGVRAIVAGIRAYAVATGPHPDLLQRVGPGGLELSLNAVVTVSRDSRRRTIDIGRHVSRRRMLNMLKAWISGDDARFNRLFGKAIEDEYAQGMEIEDITAMWFRQG